jgi:hypothetical protein
MSQAARFHGQNNDWNFTQKRHPQKKIVSCVGSFPLSAVLMVKGTP